MDIIPLIESIIIYLVVSHLSQFDECDLHHGVLGSCKVKDGYYEECNRFRAKEDDGNFSAYCGHDISAHEILGMIQDGKKISLAVAAAPKPLHTKGGASTAFPSQEERRGLLKTKQRVPDKRRRISMDEDEPQIAKRSSVALVAVIQRRVPTPAPRRVAKLIAMHRQDALPQTVFDCTGLGVNFIEIYLLTTAPDKTNMLKSDTTMGEPFARKFYPYTRHTPKTSKPTQYWSKKWPSERVLAF